MENLYGVLIDIQEEFNALRDQLEEAITRKYAVDALVRASQQRIAEIRERIVEAQAADPPVQNLDDIAAELVAAIDELNNSSAQLVAVTNHIQALNDAVIEVGNRAVEIHAQIEKRQAAAEQEIGFIPDPPPAPANDNNDNNGQPMRGGRHRRVSRRSRVYRRKSTRRRRNY